MRRRLSETVPQWDDDPKGARARARACTRDGRATCRAAAATPPAATRAHEPQASACATARWSAARAPRPACQSRERWPHALAALARRCDLSPEHVDAAAEFRGGRIPGRVGHFRARAPKFQFLRTGRVHKHFPRTGRAELSSGLGRARASRARGGPWAGPCRRPRRLERRSDRRRPAITGSSAGRRHHAARRQKPFDAARAVDRRGRCAPASWPSGPTALFLKRRGSRRSRGAAGAARRVPSHRTDADMDGCGFDGRSGRRGSLHAAA